MERVPKSITPGGKCIQNRHSKAGIPTNPLSGPNPIRGLFRIFVSPGN